MNKPLYAKFKFLTRWGSFSKDTIGWLKVGPSGKPYYIHTSKRYLSTKDGKYFYKTYLAKGMCFICNNKTALSDVWGEFLKGPEVKEPYHINLLVTISQKHAWVFKYKKLQTLEQVKDEVFIHEI